MYLVVLFLASSLVGCTSTHLESAHIGHTPTLVTTADLRVVTERLNPNGKAYPIVCAEPPPDVAKTLSTAAQLSADIRSAAEVGGSGAVSSASLEQLAELAGRVPGLLALRDGLFRACEAYANGTIGADAYAMVLSRYGDLLSTLLLADAAAGAGTRVLAVLNGAQAVTPAAPAANVAPPGNGRGTAGQNGAGQGGKVGNGGQASDAGDGPAPASGAGAGMAKPGQGASAAPLTAIVADALVQMQWQYFQAHAYGPLVVACINSADPTRVQPDDGSSNKMLADVCPHFMGKLADAMVASVRAANRPNGSAPARLSRRR